MDSVLAYSQEGEDRHQLYNELVSSICAKGM